MTLPGAVAIATLAMALAGAPPPPGAAPAGEGFVEGYQSVPVDWRVGSARKRAFFERVAEITGAW